MATELFDGRHYPSVVALVSDALERAPEDVDLLLIRARAHLVLRADLEAQADLRDIIRIDGRCHHAYRLLGELAARNEEHGQAAIFFREALRLDPTDEAASAWLAIVELSSGLFAMGTLDVDDVGDVDDDFDDLDYDETNERAPVVAAPRTRYAKGSSPALPSYDRYPRPVAAAPVVEPPGFGDHLAPAGPRSRTRQ